MVESSGLSPPLEEDMLLGPFLLSRPLNASLPHGKQLDGQEESGNAWLQGPNRIL